MYLECIDQVEEWKIKLELTAVRNCSRSVKDRLCQNFKKYSRVNAPKFGRIAPDYMNISVISENVVKENTIFM